MELSSRFFMQNTLDIIISLVYPLYWMEFSSIIVSSCCKVLCETYTKWFKPP